mgnify:CR=1 FL=1
MPSKRQWRLFFRILTPKEKIIFFIFLTSFVFSLFYLGFIFYLKETKEIPANGGSLIEGVVGYPRFINPIYSPISDIDQGLVELAFSGLMKYDSQGNLVPDLVESYEIKEGGKVYDVYLKDNLYWSDSHPLTADDVIFTVKIIQDPDYKSPQMIKWLGVDVEKISDSAIRFKLKNPYCCFLETLTQKVIPKHIWENVGVQNFPFSVYNNLKVVGSGPFKLKEVKQDVDGKITSLTLTRNPYYFGKSPYLEQIVFVFFENEESLLKNYKKEKIKSFSLNNLENLNKIDKKDFYIYRFVFPRYFALFFNPEKTKILSEKNVKLALNYATNKNEILEKILLGYGKIVYSPVLPEIYHLTPKKDAYPFNFDLAQELLDKAGFLINEEGKRIKKIKISSSLQFKTDLKEGSRGEEVENLQKCLSKDPQLYPSGDINGYFGKTTKEAVIKFQEKYSDEILVPFGLSKGTGIVSKATREKLNKICFPEESLNLKLSISTIDQPILKATANFLKEEWEKLGATIEIKIYSEKEIKEVIKERDYEILLFGETLGLLPDFYSFWHSNQKRDPGQNLALYQNQEVDKILEESRQTINESERKEKLEKLQDILIEEVPAIFLYNIDYLYLAQKKVNGIQENIITEPAKRFINIENWYTKTKRIWQ